MFFGKASRQGFELSVRSNVAELARDLDYISKKQLPFATALALTRTAVHVRRIEKKEIGSVFDRPTRFARRSVKMRGASKNRLTASVFIPDLQGRSIGGGKYLRAEVFSGPRHAKRHEILLRQRNILRPDEFTVPARGMTLDAYGNLPSSFYQKMLSQLQARSDPSRNEGERGKRRRLRRGKGGNYFVGGLEGRSPIGSRLPRGIYERFGLKAIRAVLIFVRQPTYNQLFDFYGIAKVEAPRRFPKELGKALDYALASRLADKKVRKY